jgi:hypothetical protein
MSTTGSPSRMRSAAGTPSRGWRCAAGHRTSYIAHRAIPSTHHAAHERVHVPPRQVGCFEDERRLRAILAKYGALKSLPVRVQKREARFQPQPEAWLSKLPKDVKALEPGSKGEVARRATGRRPHLAPRHLRPTSGPPTSLSLPRSPAGGERGGSCRPAPARASRCSRPPVAGPARPSPCTTRSRSPTTRRPPPRAIAPRPLRA